MSEVYLPLFCLCRKSTFFYSVSVWGSLTLFCLCRRSTNLYSASVGGPWISILPLSVVHWPLFCLCLRSICLYFASVGGSLTSILIIIIINPLTARVVGAPQMILQPVFSIFPCSPLPSGTCRTPGLSIPWCCLPTSSFVRLVFFPLSLCRARWFWPNLMNGRHDHTTAVCVSLRSSGDLHVVHLPAGCWHGLPRW